MGIKERITPVQVRQTVTFGQKLFFGQGGVFGKPQPYRYIVGVNSERNPNGPMEERIL